MNRGTSKTINLPKLAAIVALASVFALLFCIPLQNAWAGRFTGAYLTDVNGNPIGASSSIDVSTIAQGIVLHLGPNADSIEIYHGIDDVMPATTYGMIDLETGAVISGTLEMNIIDDGTSSSGYYVFYPSALQPGKQYQFVISLMRSEHGVWSPSNGYFERYSASFLTPGGDEGLGDGGETPDGSIEEGDGDPGGPGSGDSIDTSPDAGDFGGDYIAGPEMGVDNPLPQTGSSTDATVNMNDWKATGVGPQAADGHRDPETEGTPVPAPTTSGLEAAAATFRDAARGASVNTLNPSFGEDGKPNTGRQVTGAQLASMGTVRTLLGTKDAVEQVEEMQQETMDLLMISGYPLLWMVLMAAVVLALPLGILSRAGSMGLALRVPTRLEAA